MTEFTEIILNAIIVGFIRFILDHIVSRFSRIITTVQSDRLRCRKNTTRKDRRKTPVRKRP